MEDLWVLISFRETRLETEGFSKNHIGIIQKTRVFLHRDEEEVGKILFNRTL